MFKNSNFNCKRKSKRRQEGKDLDVWFVCFRTFVKRATCGFGNGAAISHVRSKPCRLWRLALPNIAMTDKSVNPILLPFRHSHYFNSSGSLGVQDKGGKSSQEGRGGATRDARNLPN
jgi:hypothetical protein